MELERFDLEGLALFKPRVFGDSRGYFLESYRDTTYSEAGCLPFVQDNVSRSAKGVLRGLHFQPRQPQGKLVTVLRGQVFDVAVDLRPGSPTYKQWRGVILDDESHHQFYVPPGFAHGFVVLSDIADFHYKCTAYYRPDDQAAIRWDDPDLAIDWPIADPILSDKDSAAPFFRDL